jgi:hypothetical protein
MRDDISSFLRSLSILIRRYSNSFVPIAPVRALKSTGLTTSAGRRYTGISRWECSFPACLVSFHASLHRTAVWNQRIEINFHRESAAALCGT